MKSVFSFVLLFCPFLVYGQVSDDSLKAVCIAKYKQDILAGGSVYLKNEIKIGNLTGDVRELFKGYFTDIRVLLINHRSVKPPKYIIDDDPNVYPRLYAFDVRTGYPAELENYATFNKIINSGSKKITNLDKCYLYLFLNGMGTYGLIGPGANRTGIGKNSVFLKEGQELLHSNCGLCQVPDPAIPYKAIRAEVAKSANRNIFIYSVVWVNSKSETQRYTFVFDRKDNLTNVILQNVIGIKDDR